VTPPIRLRRATQGADQASLSGLLHGSLGLFARVPHAGVAGVRLAKAREQPEGVGGMPDVSERDCQGRAYPLLHLRAVQRS